LLPHALDDVTCHQLSLHCWWRTWWNVCKRYLNWPQLSTFI